MRFASFAHGTGLNAVGCRVVVLLGRYGPVAVCAGRNPLPPDGPGASRPRSGPADVPTGLLVAARNGDPAAFAQFVEHWDVHLRPFVHHTLAGDGSTDRVLAATYVRAFRALPRYRAAKSPGLWLHRIAYIAVVDEVRRLTRDPMRRHARAHALPTAAVPAGEAGTTDGGSDEFDPITIELRRLAPDQRALAVLIDLEGFQSDDVADAFDTAPEMVHNRVGSARRVIMRAGPDHGNPDGDPDGDPDDEEPHQAQAQSEIVRGLLAGLAVPPSNASFWPELGRRLLAERERPASPTLDPVARLARAHPADLGFRPKPGPSSVSVSTLATQASHRRPRRRWGRPAAIVAAVLAVAGLLASAIFIGTSSPTPDGSVSGTDLARSLANAFDADRYLSVDAVVDEPGPGKLQVSSSFHLVTGQDGSWVVSRTDALDQATFDSTTGDATRLVIIEGTNGGAPAGLAGEDHDVATGAPDPAATRPDVLSDLAAIGPLIRTAVDVRAEATTVGEVAAWTYARTVPSGDGGAPERWAVSVRRSDGFPMRIERTSNGTLVRRIRFSGWTPASDVPPNQFTQLFPAGTRPSITERGFGRVDLGEVRSLGAGDAVTPAWLPEGFESAAVAVRAEAPAGAPTTGAGTNPPDVDVASLGYQRGPEQITVTTRSTTAPAADWTDPFATAPTSTTSSADTGSKTLRRTLGDGRFNQTPVRITTDAVGRAQLWGISEGVVFTVGGDLTAAEAFRLAASLR